MGMRGKRKELEKLVINHIHTYLPFEMKPICKEGKILEDPDKTFLKSHSKGIFMLFEGYVAIYRHSTHQKTNNEDSDDEDKEKKSKGFSAEHGTFFK